MSEIIIVEEERQGERLDAYIASLFAEITRSAVQRLVEQGNILVGGKEVKSSYKISAGEEISLNVPPP